MSELGLQILKAKQSLLAFREVTDEARENAALAEPGFPNRKLHWKGAAVAVQPARHPANADDLAFPSGEIVDQILIVPLAVR